MSLMDLADRYLSSVATSGSNQLCLCAVRPHFLYYLAAMVKNSGSGSSLGTVLKGVIKKVFKSPDVAEEDNVKAIAANSGWLWEAQQLDQPPQVWLQLGQPPQKLVVGDANADDAWKQEPWNVWSDEEWAEWQREKKNRNTKRWPDKPAVDNNSLNAYLQWQVAWAWPPQVWWNLWTDEEWTEWQRAKDSPKNGNCTYKKSWPGNPYVNSEYNSAHWIDYEQPESSEIGGQLPLAITIPTKRSRST
jgi:hypothetical protein